MYLTKRQKQIFDYIKEFIRKQGYAPSIDEMRRKFGLGSVATIHKHLKFLEQKNLIRRAPHQSRAIELIPQPGFGGSSSVQVPLLGTIAAGHPIEAIATDESIAVPEEMLAGGSTYVLRVRGDSMIDEQICDGDFVIIEDRKAARNGEVVVALIDGEEVTLKKYYDEGETVRLQPANPAMDPIILDKRSGDLAIQGIVIGVLRKY